MNQTLNAAAEFWIDRLWTVSWQAAVLAGLFAVVAWLLSHAAATVRYWLCQMLAIKLLIWPFWTLPLPWPNQRLSGRTHSLDDPVEGVSKRKLSVPKSSGVNLGKAATPAKAALHRFEPVVTAPPMIQTGSSHSNATQVGPQGGLAGSFVRRTPLSWRVYLLGLWTVGVSVQLMKVARQYIRLRACLAKCKPADERLVALLRDLAERIRLRRIPTVLIAPGSESPFSCGVMSPTVVVSEAVCLSLQADQLRLALAHELSHIRRRDLFWCWLPQLLLVFYFFHPVSYWIADRIRLESELACDHGAMSACDCAAGDYADTLLQVICLPHAETGAAAIAKYRIVH